MATKSAPKKGAAKASVPPVTPAVTDNSSNAANFLQENCKEVHVEVAWFRTTEKIDETNANRMLGTVGASKQAATLTKRLVSSKVPVIKELNAAKARIHAYVASMTIPIAALPAHEAERPMDFLTKSAGSRLIMVRDIEEFEKKLALLRDELKAAAIKAKAAITEVREASKALLADLYDEKTYVESLFDSIGVRGPFYTEVGFKADFAKLAPEACKRAMKQLTLRLQGTVELAAGDFCKELAEAMESIASQLTSRVRLHPLPGHPRRDELNGLEVVEQQRHAEDDEIPEGSVQICVRVKLKSGEKKKSDLKWLPVMTEQEFQELRPKETGEKCKVFDSTVANLRNKLNAFDRIGEMMGQYAEPIAAQIRAIESLLIDGRGNPIPDDKLAKDMRNSDAFRGQLQRALSSIAVQVRESSALSAGSTRKRKIGKLKADA